MANVTVNVKGLKEIDDNLKQLPDDIQKKALRGAVSAGARLIRDASKTLAPVDEGKLRDGIRITSRLNFSLGQATAKVFVSVKKAFYGRFVEFGTKAHLIEPKNAEALKIGNSYAALVNHPGARPHPFMRPAFDANKEKAVTAIADKLRDAIAKFKART